MGVAPIATGGNPSNPAPTMPGPDQNSVPGALAPDTRIIFFLNAN
jgi:hypothetical protein